MLPFYSTHAGRPRDLPHLPTSPVAPRCRHPNTACMHEPHFHAFFAPYASLYLCMSAHTSAVPTYPTCPPPIPPCLTDHLPHATVCSNTPPSPPRPPLTHPGRESEPFVKCPPPHCGIASVSVAAAIITLPGRRIMSPAAESCQSDTWTACQPQFNHVRLKTGRKQIQQIPFGGACHDVLTKTVCISIKKKKKRLQ